MDRDISLQPAAALIELYRRKDISPVEAAKAALARIERYNGAINAVCFVREEDTLAQARLSERRWLRGEPLDLLDGVPVTVKDVMHVSGWPTRRGSRLSDAAAATGDTPLVARLREAGAVFIGKTTTAEFGWKGVTDGPLTGVTRNPWNTERTTGGSSGGAAAAVAVGIGTLATGSDAAGSIRMPASFCGVFGLKPSFGVVPTYPRSSFGTLSHSGPITRAVADAALMMTVMSRGGGEGGPPSPLAGVDFRDGLGTGIEGLRVACSADLGYAAVEPEVRRLVTAAVARLAELGAEVSEIAPPFAEPRATIDVQWRTSLIGILAGYDEAQQREIDPGLVEMARRQPPPTLADYLRSENERAALAGAMQRLHASYDILVTPVLPMPAFTAGQLLADPARQRWWLDWSPFCYPFNLTGQPAASVPCGLTEQGLPVGLQIVGPLYGDRLVLRVARALEQAMPPRLPPMALS
jgi:aspartyl-tRNA(Asn)/glutamyl-tRNA(Gln) amidotransferase subunit A